MLQKNSFLQFFTSCYTNSRQQSILLPSSIKLRPNQIKNDPKISLKKGKHQSFQQVNKFTSTAQFSSKANIKLKPRKLSIKQNKHEQCLMFASNKSHEKHMPQLQKVNEVSIKSYEYAPTTKLVKFHYQANTNKQDKPLQFQKTTKKLSTNDKENTFFHRTTENMRQIKELNKEKFISDLENYKQSLVSITFEMRNSQPQFQQSMIEVNFFNPSKSQTMELEKCLHNRK